MYCAIEAISVRGLLQFDAKLTTAVVGNVSCYHNKGLRAVR